MRKPLPMKAKAPCQSSCCFLTLIMLTFLCTRSAPLRSLPSYTPRQTFPSTSPVSALSVYLRAPPPWPQPPPLRPQHPTQKSRSRPPRPWPRSDTTRTSFPPARAPWTIARQQPLNRRRDQLPRNRLLRGWGARRAMSTRRRRRRSGRPGGKGVSWRRRGFEHRWILLLEFSHFENLKKCHSSGLCNCN